MKLLDKIALNRLISIITSFILGLLKIFAPHVDIKENNTDDRWFPNLRKKLKRKKQ
jgi:hypothetical protein